ncbi:hypothetical protein DFH27DRAFT_523323 [Peziza echinospora]|nr:hypothetical protein DFH27DRAFT_523323 [Peziza echinospora]
MIQDQEYLVMIMIRIAKLKLKAATEVETIRYILNRKRNSLVSNAALKIKSKSDYRIRTVVRVGLVSLVVWFGWWKLAVDFGRPALHTYRTLFQAAIYSTIGPSSWT